MFDDFGLINKSNNASAEINIGPLIDLVFILLIFFVVTTNLTVRPVSMCPDPRRRLLSLRGRKRF